MKKLQGKTKDPNANRRGAQCAPYNQKEAEIGKWRSMSAATNAISLIALIITIIVIIILAAIVIFSGLNTPDRANLAKFMQEMSDFRTAIQQDFFQKKADYAISGKTRSDAQIYYIISQGGNPDIITDINKDATKENGYANIYTLDELGVSGKNIEGTYAYLITADTNVKDWKTNKTYYEQGEKHYLTDKGDVFVLKGYRVEQDGTEKWYLNERVVSNVSLAQSDTNTNNDDNSNILLSFVPTETESRAIILKVMAIEKIPTKVDLQSKTPGELQDLFLEACISMGAPFTTWSEIIQFVKEETEQDVTTVREVFVALEMETEEISDEYDFIIQSYNNHEYTFTCTGNEDVTGTSAEFIVTNPNPKITATTTTGDYVEKIWDEYPNSKIETFSDIQTSNYTLKKDDYDVIIPAGFAYGTSSNVGAVTTGLVITDSVDENGYSNGNEFVWIPIDKTNLTVGKTDKKMAEISSGTDYKGILYNLELDPTGNTVIDIDEYDSSLR